MRLATGLVLALVSTVALSGGFYLQHTASGTVPALTLRRPLASLAALFTNLTWTLGFAVGLAGWALYIAALGFAPLSLVQAVSAAGVGLLAVAVRLGGGALSRRERAAVAASLAGLVLIAVSLPATAVSSSPPGWQPPLGWVLASMFLAGLAAMPAAGRLAPGAGLAVAAGLLYSAGDVATKAAVSGTAPVWVFAALLPLCHGLAFAALQLAFQRGTALATAGVSTLLTNILPILAGVTIFAEHLPAGAVGVARGLGFAAVVAGATALAVTGRAGRPGSGQAAWVPSEHGGSGPGGQAGEQFHEPFGQRTR
jgi:hypothetical protein